MGTASPAGWSQATLSLLGVLPLRAGGLWKARLPPRVTAPLAASHPRLGFYLPPHAPVVGGLPGASPQLLPPLPPPYLGLRLRGWFVFFYFWFFFSCLLCPFVFKDAAGQTGREGVCLPIWLRGLRRGCLGRAETSCNTVLPGWWPEVACNSRGQVTPSTSASAPPSALPPRPQPALSLPGVGQSFSKAVPTCVSEASLGRGLAALSACLRLSCCAPPSIKTSGASCCSSV